MNPTLVRRALAALTVIAIFGAGFELAVERHWRSVQQLVPWAALALLAVGVLLLLATRLSGTVRVIAAVVLLASAFGVFAHVSANMTVGSFSGALDGVSMIGQWWHAFTKSVGDAPPLAPGMLAQAALLLLLATYVTGRTSAGRHAEAPVAVKEPAER
ncbi:hypothetical protein AB0K05_40130 [Nonomuraea sp. NPDC049486]|uniref:hypothetical protein n=1 Tax=unclassified Nonomuraea TaxID=2593643 RepID=UPI003443926F